MLEIALGRLDAACSRFRPDSELSRANACAGRTVEISPLLAELVAVGLRAYDTSEGRVDPTLGSELRAAGYDRTFTLVRERGTWAFTTRPRRDSPRHDVQLDIEQRTLRVPLGVELDLGATAKAWCADRMAVLIARLTNAGVLVSLGGDIAVAGTPPSTGLAGPHRERTTRRPSTGRARSSQSPRAASRRRARPSGAGAPTAARRTTSSTRDRRARADAVAMRQRGRDQLRRRKRRRHSRDRARRRRHRPGSRSVRSRPGSSASTAPRCVTAGWPDDRRDAA